MDVKLIGYTKDAEKIVGVAAYTSISKKTPQEKLEEYVEEKGKKIIKNIIDFGHHSVIEHASFTFAISGVSRACTHQLVRHRIASYTQQSQRYVKFENGSGYVIPPSIEKNEEAKKIFEECIKKINDSYKKLLDLGIPAEDARFVFPNAATSNIIVTMNARELLHFFGLRCCMRAQWEIRELAIRMLIEVKKKFPLFFEKAGPRCVQLGYCPEGKFTCGKCQEMKKIYMELRGEENDWKKLKEIGAIIR